MHGQLGRLFDARAPNRLDLSDFFEPEGRKGQIAAKLGTRCRESCCSNEIDPRLTLPFQRAILSFVLNFISLSHAFMHCCDATILLFMWADMPILQPTDSPATPGRQTSKDERGTAMFATLVRFFREWRRYSQSLSELSRLGDRELADIGISRSDIRRVAWEASHRAA
jgi:uncharacterized protein YjiS (DUF1127 family)